MEVVDNFLFNVVILSALGFVLGTAVHELTHIVAARAAGYDAALEAFTQARISGEFDPSSLPAGVRLALVAPTLPGVAFLGVGVLFGEWLFVVAGVRCAMLSEEDMAGVRGDATV